MAMSRDACLAAATHTLSRRSAIGWLGALGLCTSLPASSAESVVLSSRRRPPVERVFRTELSFFGPLVGTNNIPCEPWIFRTLDTTSAGEREIAVLRMEDTSCTQRPAPDALRSPALPFIIYRVDKAGRLLSGREYSERGGVSFFASDRQRLDAQTNASRLQRLLMFQAMQWMVPRRPVRAGESWRTRLDRWDEGVEEIEFRTVLIGQERHNDKAHLRVRQTGVVQLREPNEGLVTTWSSFLLAADTLDTQRIDLGIGGMPEPNGNMLRVDARWLRL